MMKATGYSPRRRGLRNCIHSDGAVRKRIKVQASLPLSCQHIFLISISHINLQEGTLDRHEQQEKISTCSLRMGNFVDRMVPKRPPSANLAEL